MTGITRTFGLCVLLSGCAMTSGVMDAGNGTYLISAYASPIRGGATGANSVAYQDAQQYCVDHIPGTHAVVVDANERDVYQTAISGSATGFGGGTFASGHADLRFRCAQ